jgi:DNA-directed RNA polymerase subunit L
MTDLNSNTVKVSLDDLKKEIDVKLVNSDDENNGYETSECTINIAGKDINHVIINTLRRVILTLIPVYGFDSNNINITKNTSIFNNDMMRLRLSNFPVYLSKDLNRKYRDLKKLTYDQVLNPESSLDKSKELEYKANLGSAEIDITQDENKTDITDNLTIVVNVKNTSDNDIMNVMTNTQGVKFYFGKEQISHIYAIPLLIIQLQPGQEFSCTMISSLNNAIYNAIFRPCTKCYYKENNESNFDFTVLSRRQISEKDIIIRACKIIKDKIISTEETFIENINRYGSKNNANAMSEEDLTTEHLRSGTIIIEGEQHTIGNLLARYLQDHKSIQFAGYSVGHPNVNQVEIQYECDSDITKTIKDISKKIQSIYNTIENKVNKLSDLGYKYI